MAKIVLDDVTRADNVQKMNENFTKLEQELQNKVLYRDNPTGEPNQMENDLDMNSNDILNVGTIDAVELQADNLVVGGVNLQSKLNEAAASATASQTSASASSTSASASASSASEAAASAAEAATAVAIKHFDSVSAMQAAVNLVVGEKVRTFGYYTPGDGGGNDYEIVAAATGTDDGFLYIDLSGSGLQAKSLLSGGKAKAEMAGGVASPSTDNDPYFTVLLNLGYQVELKPGGVYGTSGTQLPDGGSILCSDPSDLAEIRLIDASNNHTVYTTDSSNISISNVRINGNQAGQTKGSGNNWRGFYALGQCHNIRMDNVEIINAVDHGLFLSDGGTLSNECGKDSLFTNVRAINCGSSTHLGSGGAGGSGLVGGTDSTVWVGCYGTGNNLNGFKSRGKHIGCDAYENIGGGYETGFDTPEVTQTKYIACRAYKNTGDGWRNQGQGDELTFVGCEALENDQAGVTLLNNVHKVSFQGCWFKNNGQDTVTSESDTVGFSGVYITATSGKPNDISFSGCHFIDNQGAKTQRNGVHINKLTEGVTISDDCVFDGALTQPLRIEPAAQASEVKIGNCKGLDTYKSDVAASTITGTTSQTSMKSATIKGRSITFGTVLSVVAKGSATGTSGTKIVRLFVGGTSALVMNQAAGDQNQWVLKAFLYRIDGSQVLVSWTLFESDNTSATGSFAVSESNSSDLLVDITGQLSVGSDLVSVGLFKVGVE